MTKTSMLSLLKKTQLLLTSSFCKSYAQMAASISSKVNIKNT